MNFAKYFIAMLCFGSHLSFGQTSNSPYQYIPKYDPPKSPNASSFERYTSIANNLQTGQINPSIPLMSFQVDNLTVPLTLKYSNSGLKVSDVASWVGMGWNLDAGGTITRSVKGLPDDSDYGLLQTNIANQQQLLLNNQLTGKARFNYFDKLSKQMVDTEHDIFNYSVLGISGSFYINKSGQCVQLPKTNNKIQFIKDQFQRIATFTITDDSGNDYTFSIKEESIIVANANNYSGTVDYYYNSLKGTSWYLSQIKTRNNQLVDFLYNEYQYNQMEKTESHSIPSVANGGAECASPAFTLQKNYITSRIIVKQLSKITWNNGTIDFIAGANRSDIEQINGAAASGTSTTVTVPCLGGLKMSQKLTPNYTALIQNISFDYAQAPRLFLKKINFQNPNGALSHAYLFKYNNVDYSNALAYNWPSYDPYSAKYNARDYWGYYNGAINNTGMIPWDAISDAPPILHAQEQSGGPVYPPVTGININAYRGLNNRVPDPAFAVYGTLEEITYPTGGRTVFSYEGNVIKKQSVNASTPESVTLINTLKSTTDQQGNTFVTLGGTRIKQMNFHNPGAYPPILTTNIVYDQEDVTCAFTPFYYTYTQRFNSESTVGNNSGLPGCYLCSNVYTYNFNSSGTVTDDAPIVQYKTVKEFSGLVNGGGQIVHSYKSAGKGNEIFFWAPYTAPNVFSWQSKEIQTANQLPDGSDVQVKSTISGDTNGLQTQDFDFKVALIRKDDCGENPTASGQIYYTPAIEPRTDAEADVVVSRIYTWAKLAILTENYRPSQTKEITYDKNGQQLDVTSYYNYDLSFANPLLPSSTSSKNSKGENTKTYSTYPQSYFLGSFPNSTDPAVNGLINLINRNILAIPVEQITTIVKGSIEYVTGAKLFIFYPDKISLSKILNLTLTSPIPLTNFVKSSVNASGIFSYDNRYQVEREFHAYNSANQLLEFSDNNVGLRKSLLWDYNSTYQIAEISNASQNDVAYTSFEADGSGNWTIGSTNRSSIGVTGNRSYPLTTASLITKSGLTTSKSYVLSYWTSGTSPLTISGTITGYPIKGLSSNGWTYYEHVLTGVTSVSLSSSTAVNIDEVKLLPRDAAIITWTYNPLVGITSSVKNNADITHYDYDEMLRLKNIIDKNGNIIKHTDYHYQQQ